MLKHRIKKKIVDLSVGEHGGNVAITDEFLYPDRERGLYPDFFDKQLVIKESFFPVCFEQFIRMSLPAFIDLTVEEQVSFPINLVL